MSQRNGRKTGVVLNLTVNFGSNKKIASSTPVLHTIVYFGGIIEIRDVLNQSRVAWSVICLGTCVSGRTVVACVNNIVGMGRIKFFVL